MKHKYTDEEYQAAIDAACQEVAEAHPYTSQLLTLENYRGSNYDGEAPARLDLLKSALAKLPEPQPPTADGKTPGQVACNTWHRRDGDWTRQLSGDRQLWEATASAVLAAFGGAEILRWKDAAQSIREEINKQQDRAEKAEAELARKNEMWENQMIVIRRLQLQVEELEDKSYLSTLRPIAEAGEVPAGAVRVFGELHDDGDWIVGTLFVNGDTHFADILPPEAKAPAVESEPLPIATLAKNQVSLMPEQSAVVDQVFQEEVFGKPATTFTAHGKTWNVHVPGDSMPCAGGASIMVLFSGGTEAGSPYCAADLRWNKLDSIGDIIGWRYADEPVKPWTPAVGDVVMLKSGGPKMTVVQVDGSECRTMWFDNNQVEVGDFFNATFQPA